MTAARWACAVATLGAAAYLLLEPATADHAAQEYRAWLVRDAGLGLWNNGWFAGHHTPAYSLLSPPLGALLGVRLAGAIAAVVAAGLFALIAERRWGQRAGTVAAVWFSVGVVATLVSGRLAFLLGVVAGLAAVLALQRARPVLAVALAFLTPLASPVAGLFLALAAVALGIAAARASAGGAAARVGEEPRGGPVRNVSYMSVSNETPLAGSGRLGQRVALAGRDRLGRRVALAGRGRLGRRVALAGSGRLGRRVALAGSGRLGPVAAIAFAALAPAALLAILFPEGGSEPFVASAFWPALAAIALFGLALPARERALRIGCAIYALVCIAAFAFSTPLGGNVTRLGALLAGPVLAGAVLATRPRERRAAFVVLALGLAYFQAYPAVRDVVRASGDPSTAAAYYAPLIRYLDSRPGSFRVEIPFTANHWEAAYVAPRVPLARGWQRQLDRRYGALFYDGELTAARYRAWLHRRAVGYVAVPDAKLDYSARDEARLIDERPSWLRPVWRNAHWRVFAVAERQPLVSGAAGTITLESGGGFTLRARRRGNALVRVRHTRWWAVTGGRACVAPGPDGMTLVRVLRPGSVRVQARLKGDRCRS